MSKKPLINENPSIFTQEILASFDTCYLLVYSIMTFIGGVIGDIYDLRNVLAFSFSMLFIFYGLLGIAGHL